MKEMEKEALMDRVEELIRRYCGALPPGTFPPGWLERERAEWDHPQPVLFPQLEQV
jgi:hypothetical protein